jgi:uncharacterized membrane protein YuzA (DUF378 family)
MNRSQLLLALPLIGGLNWGLVALARFDLVAKLTGNDFGETNALSRVIYAAVGAASAYGTVQLVRGETPPTG